MTVVVEGASIVACVCEEGGEAGAAVGGGELASTATVRTAVWVAMSMRQARRRRRADVGGCCAVVESVAGAVSVNGGRGSADAAAPRRH